MFRQSSISVVAHIGIHPNSPTTSYLWKLLAICGTHGTSAESPDISGDGLALTFGISNYMYNVKELVVGDDPEDLVIRNVWPNVRRLGIRGHDGDDTAKPALRMVDAIGTLRSGNYPSLTMIRILDESSMRSLREEMEFTVPALAGQLQSWEIKLEDGRGDLLIPLPPSS